MIKNFVVFIVLLFPIYTFGELNSMKNDFVLKISVLSSNTDLLNGKEIGPDQLMTELENAKEKQGVVWYYRGNAAGESLPAASQVIQMVIDKKLPISMSTKPDFSDYVDETGESIPR